MVAILAFKIIRDYKEDLAMKLKKFKLAALMLGAALLTLTIVAPTEVQAYNFGEVEQQYHQYETTHFYENGTVHTKVWIGASAPIQRNGITYYPILVNIEEILSLESSRYDDVLEYYANGIKGNETAYFVVPHYDSHTVYEIKNNATIARSGVVVSDNYNSSFYQTISKILPGWNAAFSDKEIYSEIHGEIYNTDIELSAPAIYENDMLYIPASFYTNKNKRYAQSDYVVLDGIDPIYYTSFCDSIKYLGGPSAISPVNTSISINGSKKTVETYKIEDRNFVNARDFANILASTDNAIEVNWNANNSTVEITSQVANVANFVESSKVSNNILGTSQISKDGKVLTLQTYAHEGQNYFKLRDLASLAGVTTTWDETNGIVLVTE